MPDIDMGAPFDVVSFPTKNQDVSSVPIYIGKEGKTQIGWNKDTPSHKAGWKEVEGKRVSCTFYHGYGFMTEDEIWEHRQIYPRDSL